MDDFVGAVAVVAVVAVDGVDAVDAVDVDADAVAVALRRLRQSTACDGGEVVLNLQVSMKLGFLAMASCLYLPVKEHCHWTNPWTVSTEPVCALCSSPSFELFGCAVSNLHCCSSNYQLHAGLILSCHEVQGSARPVPIQPRYSPSHTLVDSPCMAPLHCRPVDRHSCYL